MGMACRFGLMGRSTKGTGEIIKHMEKASFGMQMEMSSMENGRKIKRMVMEYIYMLTEPSTKVTGLMTYNMERGLKCGLMGHSMKGNTKMGRSMEWASMCGLITPGMRVNGSKTKFLEEYS